MVIMLPLLGVKCPCLDMGRLSVCSRIKDPTTQSGWQTCIRLADRGHSGVSRIKQATRLQAAGTPARLFRKPRAAVFEPRNSGGAFAYRIEQDTEAKVRETLLLCLRVLYGSKGGVNHKAEETNQ